MSSFNNEYPITKVVMKPSLCYNYHYDTAFEYVYLCGKIHHNPYRRTIEYISDEGELIHNISYKLHKASRAVHSFPSTNITTPNSNFSEAYGHLIIISGVIYLLVFENNSNLEAFFSIYKISLLEQSIKNIFSSRHFPEITLLNTGPGSKIIERVIVDKNFDLATNYSFDAMILRHNTLTWDTQDKEYDLRRVTNSISFTHTSTDKNVIYMPKPATVHDPQPMLTNVCHNQKTRYYYATLIFNNAFYVSVDYFYKSDPLALTASVLVTKSPISLDFHSLDPPKEYFTGSWSYSSNCDFELVQDYALVYKDRIDNELDILHFPSKSKRTAIMWANMSSDILFYNHRKYYINSSLQPYPVYTQYNGLFTELIVPKPPLNLPWMMDYTFVPGRVDSSKKVAHLYYYSSDIVAMSVEFNFVTGQYQNLRVEVCDVSSDVPFYLMQQRYFQNSPILN